MCQTKKNLLIMVQVSVLFWTLMATAYCPFSKEGTEEVQSRMKDCGQVKPLYTPYLHGVQNINFTCIT